MPSIPKTPEVKAAAIDYAKPKLQAAKDFTVTKLEKIGVPTDIKSAANKLNMPNIPGLESSVGDMREYMEYVEMPSVSDLLPKKSDIKIPTVGDLKDMAKNKIGNIKDMIDSYRSEGIEGLIPKDLKEMGMEMSDMGMSPKDLIKGIADQVKGDGGGISMDTIKDILSGAPSDSGMSFEDLISSVKGKD